MPKIKIGPVFYDAEEKTVTGTGNQFLVVRVGPGGRNRLWIHKGKSVTNIHHAPYGACFGLSPAEEQLANSYLTTSIQLYRGVSITSPGASDAKIGVSRPKPSATMEEPDFTSENSTTKFVPFSTDRQVSVSFAKSSFRNGNQDELEWLLADEPYGVLVTIQVNDHYSLCIFDIGEVQVLKPPAGRTELLTPGNYVPLNIADSELSVPLAATAHDFSELGRLLNNPAWSSEGSAFIGTKTPDGIEKMRLAYNQAHYWDIFRIAKRKSEKPDSNRSQKVIDLYEGLREILGYVREKDQDQKLQTFQSEVREFSRFMQGRLR
jgi:hypothetical protein